MCESVVSYITANRPLIEDEVRRYFSNTPHKGSQTILHLIGLELDGILEEPPTVRRILAMPTIDHLTQKDPQFDEGLREIGQKYEIPIMLPEKLYLKAEK